ncbi:MAG TPA: SurA N-terminal domain-containing protein [Polyangia bacterium]|nr:SurA N-terminal domain-containing protein [Polyangia bacterium]
MLERMRKSSQSLLIYALFLFLIAIFVISFGPQSRGTSCDQVMNGDEHFAAQVAGETITRNDFRYGFMLVGGAQVPAPLAKRERLKETVMDKLIERELLAKEADRLGFVVTDEEVEDQISDAKIIGLGALHTVPRLQKDGKFNYDAFKTFLQYELGLTPKSFVEEQKRELLANRVRDLLRAGVSVSTDEVKTDFVRRNRQVNLEYLRFSGSRFQGDVALTDAEIADYAAKNDAKLRQAYEQKRFVYEKVPEQRKLRQILVKVPKDATPAVEKAAEAKANGLADRLKKGAKATGKEGLTFAELARDASDDTATKASGGELGWRAKGATNLTGDAEDKVFSAKTDALVGPLRGTDGFVITKVEGQRSGAVSYDQAKLELAEEKLREERGDAKAKAAANAAVAKLQASPGKTMKDLYPAPTDTEAASGPDKNAPPHAEETGPFSLRATRDGALVEGIGVSSQLAKAAFALTPTAPVAGPFEVSGTFVVVRLKDRKEPDLAEFEKNKVQLTRDAELTKWEQVMGDWTQARCLEAKQGHRISVNADVLRYEDSSETPAYEPCSPRRQFGG